MMIFLTVHSAFDQVFNRCFLFDYRIALNNLFGELEKVVWVSQITLSTMREAQIQSCFNSPVEFHYLTTLSELDELISEFKKIRESNGDINSTFENQLIIIDDAFGIADKSDDFWQFQESLNTNVFIFFTLFIQKSQHGN